jgi:Ca2+-binding RTX toxin-like protein
MADYDQFDEPNPAAVTVDLSRTGPQDTGLGTDTLSEMESATGGRLADTLIGTDGPNTLRGGAGTGGDTLRGAGGADFLSGGVLPSILGPDGNDTLDGGAGNDNLNGGSDTDTVTYAQAPAGITAYLTAGTATGGAGNDTLAQLENLTGSPFADTLTGSPQANEITGGAGGDTISALAGADNVLIRDGEADTASCGTEIDTATSDQESLDTVDPDCETISSLPEADPDDGGSQTPADTEVSFDLSGKRKQRILERKAVVVTASCPQEDCPVVFGGKVKPATETLAGGVAERVKLKLKPKQVRKLAAALRDGGKPKVPVTGQATDTAGNVTSDAVKIRAKR